MRVGWLLLGAALGALGACGNASPAPSQTGTDAAFGGAAGSSAGATGRSGSAGTTGAAGAEDVPRFSDAQWARLRELALDPLPAPPPDVTNRFADDAAAAALGAELFDEPGLSGALLDIDNDGGPNSLGQRGDTGKVACAGCHLSQSGFSDTRSTFQEISLGAGWTARRTPSLLDVGQAKLVMWGGRRSTLYSQVFGPIENPLEMNSSRLFVAEFIAHNYRQPYEAVFGSGSLAALSDATRFPALDAATTGCRMTTPIDHPRAQPPDPLYACHGMPGDGAEYDSMSVAAREIVTRIVVNAGKAIAAYERTLACGPSRFDAFVHGDASALSAAEQRGLSVFIGRGGCVSCHSGPYLTDQRFHTIGVREKITLEGIFNHDDHGAFADLPLAAADPVGIASAFSDGNDGRLPDAVGAELDGAFRTPALRCVAARPTYMHSGLVHSLEEVVAFFDRGGDGSGYIGTNVLSPLALSVDEQGDLVHFLKALQ